ncbi:hypothetical protein Aple_036430 [Acrocarpospora pleiomorpha]|uniref:Uncharacterized protein n=1 Tax=Acrocarpospora pleiomorpha TaxID=90975 RepID=A0A5M3XGT1_9ACTN|nr:hypothetical protein Aple_036430 [Acrocarpospora pleiomorpha]
MRHPAERVVLLENKNAFPAELRDRTGRGETAHTRTDHDDVYFLNVGFLNVGFLNVGFLNVGFLVRDHPRPWLVRPPGARLAEPT